jgi:hypothetical protein
MSERYEPKGPRRFFSSGLSVDSEESQVLWLKRLTRTTIPVRIKRTPIISSFILPFFSIE